MPQLGLATNVLVFDLGGPKLATKYRYRCRDCVVAGTDLSYHPDQWGSPDLGYQFYEIENAYEFVRASRVTWIARKQTEYFFSLMHHVWARLVLELSFLLLIYQIFFAVKRAILRLTMKLSLRHEIGTFWQG
jgi:hypothetical protein